MTKKMKRVICLLLVVVLSTSMLTGCKKGKKEVTKVDGLVPLTEDDIEISYAFWEDKPIVDKLVEAWNEVHPNIKINVMGYDSAVGFNDELLNLSAAMNLPDVFWILNECDFAIENGMLYDMTPLWENDPDAKNVLPSINDFKIGYFGTDFKWTTPVKYFPSAAFVNKALYERINEDMPKKDWTWAEYEEEVSSMTRPDPSDTKKMIYGFHCNTANYPVTWYPLAADDNCIGEFGWDGKEFHLNNWAKGLNTQANWRKSGYMAPETIEECEAMYGEASWAQDIGYVAIQPDYWWVWERFWIKDQWINNNVIWVPYVMPHEEGVKSETIISTIDFGGISAATKYPREAYEVLKYMTWGVEGWKVKLEEYPNTLALDGENPMEKNNFPICMDDEIWAGFRAWHPGSDDKYGRGEYFDYYFEHIKHPVPLAACQIPGFGTFISVNYAGVEAKVQEEGVDANDFVAELEKQANQCNQERLDELNQKFVTN